MIAVVVLTTAGSEVEAQTIARELVERRLAGCVNVIPGVHSTYRWQGAVQSESEWLLVIKTQRDRFDAVRAAIQSLNAYDVPEIVMLEVGGGDERYLAWLRESVSEGG